MIDAITAARDAALAEIDRSDSERAVAGDDEVRLGADGPGHFSPRLFDFFPGFVPAYIRPLFCRGIGPFRWAEPGVHFIRLVDEASGVEDWSNAVHVTERTPERRLCWGDPQRLRPRARQPLMRWPSRPWARSRPDRGSTPASPAGAPSEAVCRTCGAGPSGRSGAPARVVSPRHKRAPSPSSSSPE